MSNINFNKYDNDSNDEIDTQIIYFNDYKSYFF